VTAVEKTTTFLGAMGDFILAGLSRDLQQFTQWSLTAETVGDNVWGPGTVRGGLVLRVTWLVAPMFSTVIRSTAGLITLEATGEERILRHGYLIRSLGWYLAVVE